jgi:hypothetical protein
MKKYLPLILIGLGILVLVGAFLFIRKSSNKAPVEEETVKELPVDQRPVISLIPSSDGHWLDLKIDQIRVPKAETLDYELIYSTTDGGQQGVPGTVSISGQSSLERNLLLGSESSGKFRYDTGVDHGTMTVRFRDGKGKLLGKIATDFHLQTGTTILSSFDNTFTYTLEKTAKGVFFVTMQTYASSAPTGAATFSNGYAVFASDGKVYPGK